MIDQDLENQIEEGVAPIEALKTSFQESQQELNAKVSQISGQIQELNSSLNKLNHVHKGVERYDYVTLLLPLLIQRMLIRYIKERRARELENISERVGELDSELQELSGKLNGVQEVITGIQKEINESGASVANLRDNIRARKLVREISEVQKEIDSHDMEEMAKAKRNFEEKYKLAKEKEDNLRVEVSDCGFVLCDLIDCLRLIVTIISLSLAPLASFPRYLASMDAFAENLAPCNSRSKNMTQISRRISKISINDTLNS
jgi:DNA repair protein RAD50